MNFATQFLSSHKDELIDKVGDADVANKLIDRMTDLAKIGFELASIEFKSLTQGLNYASKEDMEHLKAQALQNIDLIVNDCPADALSLVIWFVINIVLKV